MTVPSKKGAANGVLIYILFTWIWVMALMEGKFDRMNMCPVFLAVFKEISKNGGKLK